MNCKECKEFIHPSYNHCPHCGALIDLSIKKEPVNYYKLAIMLLTAIVVIGSLALIIERQDALVLFLRQKNIQDLSTVFNRRNRSNDDLIGFVYDEVQLDQWKHDNGSIVEVEAHDANGYLTKIYRDAETEKTLGFVVLMPIARKILISENEAHTIAFDLASKAPFIDIDDLSLVEKELRHDPVILSDPEAGGYFSFVWKALDPTSGAQLLQTIKVHVNAETGKVFYFSSHNLGKVTVSTSPKISIDKAISIAMSVAGDHFTSADVQSRRLFVQKETNTKQYLLWEIIVHENDLHSEAKAMWVYVDANTGEIKDVQH